MRTGSEPVTARSPLRMRWWLSVWGLIWTGFGTAVFAIAGRPGWAIACGVLLLIVATDFVVVVHRIRQGASFQPGRDVPPYEDHSHRRPGSGGDTGTGPGRGYENGGDRAEEVSRSPGRSRNPGPGRSRSRNARL
ncbi:DUF6343 family protein [Streptomyces niveus]|uniref:DUF6343 family protein n=1 Tax=Streptomyces niveus TaxID=193462 RepID=UPI0033B59ABD